MQKIEELYFRNRLDAENELNLFEPECIISDGSSNIKEGNDLFIKAECDFGKNKLKDKPYSHEDVINFNFTRFRTNTKTLDNENAEFNSDQDLNVSNLCEFGFPFSEQMVDLETIQMHSIFTPEDRNKPKEVFTKCHNCEKFVIIRMCPETGDYTTCKYCFNSPFSNEITASDIMPEIVKPPIQPSKQRKESPVVGNCKSEASFRCDYCGKLFTRNWYLKQHIKLHSNQKPFSCIHCDKRFLNSSNLKQHLKTHSVEYRCCMCDKTYINIESLKLHAEKHTIDSGKSTSSLNGDSEGKKSLPCSCCNEMFSSYDNLKEHTMTHTKDMPFQCDQCDKGFRYNSTLVKHKKIHNNEYETSKNNAKEKHKTE